MSISKGFAYAFVQYSARSPIAEYDGRPLIFRTIKAARRWKIAHAQGLWPIIRLELMADDFTIGLSGRRRK